MALTEQQIQTYRQKYGVGQSSATHPLTNEQVQSYRQKYGIPTFDIRGGTAYTPPTPQGIGAIPYTDINTAPQLRGSTLMQRLSSPFQTVKAQLGYTAGNVAKAGVGALQGAYEQAKGAATPLASAITGTDSTTGAPLNVQQRVGLGGQAVAQTGQAMLGALFSPGAAGLGGVPSLQKPIEKVLGGINKVGQFGSEHYKAGLKSLGIELDPEQEKAIDQSFQLGVNAGAVLLGEKVAESKPVGDFTKGVSGKVPRGTVPEGAQGPSLPPTTSYKAGEAVRGGVNKGMEKVGTGLEAVKNALPTKIPFTKTPEQKTSSNTAKIVDELYKVENSYVNLQKARQYSQDEYAGSRVRIAESDVLPGSIDNNGTITTEGKGGPIDRYIDQTIPKAENVTRKNLERLGETVNLAVVEQNLIRTVNESGLHGKAKVAALKDVKAEIEGYALDADVNGNVPLVNIHDAKIAANKAIRDWNTPVETRAYKTAIERGLKETVEQNSSFNVKEVNAEIGKYLQDVEYLKKLNGKKVKGAKLGKYFAQVGGHITGAAIGSLLGPVGTAFGSVIGGEVAGAIKGKNMAGTFGPKTGSVTPLSEIIRKAVEKGNSPRLMLSAPPEGAPKSQMPSGPTINLPARSQSTVDAAHSYNLGNRNMMYNKPKPTTINDILSSIPQDYLPSNFMLKLKEAMKKKNMPLILKNQGNKGLILQDILKKKK